MPRKVILDVDTGTDDAVAIMTALLSPELEVLGICTVNGNRCIEMTTENTLRVVEYLGSDVAGKDVFVSDDIISSGESMLDIAYNLKKRNAKRIFTYATYAIFTNGLESFDKAYQEGMIDGVFGSNLTYRTEALKNRPWFYEVDVSKYIAYFISALNHDMSVSAMIDPHQKIDALLERRRQERSLQQGAQLTF